MSDLLTNKEKALDRIKLLLATGTDERANESEREIAMRMALKLLAAHNLEMADTMTTVTKEKRDTETMEQYTCPWRRTVAGAIARMFFCNYFYQGIPGKQKTLYTFVGLESNAKTAVEMTKYLIASITKEGLKKKRELKANAAFETSFFNAAAARISQRCIQMQREAEMENTPQSGSTALALVNVYEQEREANVKFIAEELGIKLRVKATSLKSLDSQGTRMGDEFGKNVSLSNQIGHHKPRNNPALK